MNFLFFCLLFTRIADAPGLNESELFEPVCLKANITEKQKIVACAIEKIARSREFKSEHIIRGLIINAFAESRLDPFAISSGRTSFGIFQLHINGLGHGMPREDMFDVDISTNVIIDYMKNQNINYNEVGERQTIELICSTVLKPRDKKLQTKNRLLLLDKLF